VLGGAWDCCWHCCVPSKVLCVHWEEEQPGKAALPWCGGCSAEASSARCQEGRGRATEVLSRAVLGCEEEEEAQACACALGLRAGQCAWLTTSVCQGGAPAKIQGYGWRGKLQARVALSGLGR